MRPGERPAVEDRAWGGQRPLRAEHLVPVRAHGGLLTGEVDEDDLVGELGAPRVAHEQRAGRLVGAGDQPAGGQLPVRAQDEVVVAGHGDGAPLRAEVADLEPRDLHRVGARDELHQVQTQVVGLVQERGVPEPVPGGMPAGRHRARGRRGDHAGQVVAHVDDLGDQRGDRVVAPRGELVVPAVAPPGMPGAFCGREEAELFVRDDVRPGHGGGSSPRR